LTTVHARTTTPLRQASTQLGAALGGEAGSRLAMPTSPRYPAAPCSSGRAAGGAGRAVRGGAGSARPGRVTRADRRATPDGPQPGRPIRQCRCLPGACRSPLSPCHEWVRRVFDATVGGGLSQRLAAVRGVEGPGLRGLVLRHPAAFGTLACGSATGGGRAELR